MYLLNDLEALFQQLNPHIFLNISTSIPIEQLSSIKANVFAIISMIIAYSFHLKACNF